MRQVFTFLFFLSALFRRAQTPGAISGKIMDQQNKPIHGATVSLLKIKDSSVVKFTATDKNGDYEFVINKAGTYLISASSIGFSR